MPSTTIKVPVELRDRLAELASREHTTLAGAITQSLDAAENAVFWAEVARTDDERGAVRGYRAVRRQSQRRAGVLGRRVVNRGEIYLCDSARRLATSQGSADRPSSSLTTR